MNSSLSQIPLIEGHFLGTQNKVYFSRTYVQTGNVVFDQKTKIVVWEQSLSNLLLPLPTPQIHSW